MTSDVATAPVAKMRRVMIVGQPGSGKSTLARRLGARLDLPVVHIDHIHWKPGWVERPAAEKTALVRQAVATEAWVFEGGHSITWPERLARADVLVWLDVGVWRRLWRCNVRAWRFRGQVRADMQVGCPENFGAEHWAFVRWIWQTRVTGRRAIERLFGNAPQDKRTIRLTNFADVDRWLESLP